MDDPNQNQTYQPPIQDKNSDQQNIGDLMAKPQTSTSVDNQSVSPTEQNASHLPPISSVAVNGKPLPIRQGFGDEFSAEETGVSEMPVSQVTTEQVVYGNERQSGNKEPKPDSGLQNTINQLAKAVVTSGQKEQISDNKPASEGFSQQVAPPEKTDQVPITSQSQNIPPTQGVDVSSKEFVEKLDLEHPSQQIFTKAAASDNPEQVFDSVEEDKDKKLAQQLIQQVGLSPDLVQKALDEKTQKIQQEQSSVPPQPVSEEYQKEMQRSQSNVDQSTDVNHQ